jgi:Lrp/AsnC family leucine-responsive transcriptional regulator
MPDRRNSAAPAFATLDDIDRRILAELQADARLRTSELARRAGLSAPAIAERVRRLEDTGVVGYHAEVEPRAIGYSLCALVRVSPTSGGLHQVPQLARDIPEVTEC